MPDRSRRVDVFLALAGAAGLLIFVALHSRAFPQAAVEIRVDREAAADTARRFLAARGAEREGFRSGSRYEGATMPLLFLQRTLGVEEASRWAEEEVPIWRWSHRWFRPQEKEEWRVEVGLDGEVVGYRHLVDEAAAGADLEEGEARAVAVDFLRTRGWEMDGLERVEASSRERENRTDHSFVWERAGTTIAWKEGDPEAGTGSVRIAVDVHGDEVGRYRVFLDVPEAFRREFEGVQSVGLALGFVSLALTLMMGLAALGIALARARGDGIRWRPAVAAGGVVSVLVVLQGATGFPLLAFSYPTSFNWVAYVAVAAVAGLLYAALYGVFVFFATAAGTALGREVVPERMAAFVEAFRGRVLTRGFAGESLRGYALGFLLLGYLTGFYVLAQRHLGAWLPAEGPHSQIFDLWLPFLAPVAISLVAAISEEVVYRLFGISVLRRYTGMTWLALLLPAAIWAFAHSSYPVFPVYIRGIELTGAGLIFGVAFLRLGLVTCVVGHFVVDAVLIGMPLLTSGNPGYVLSGAVAVGIALVPAVLALAMIRRRDRDVGSPGRSGDAPDAGEAREAGGAAGVPTGRDGER